MLSFERRSQAFTAATPRVWDTLYTSTSNTGKGKSKGRADGPQRIVIENLLSSRPPISFQPDNLKRQVALGIRAVLDRTESLRMPASYRDIFQACEVLVNAYGKGADLCAELRLRLEQFTSSIGAALMADTSTGAQWLVRLDDEWTRFEGATRTLTGLLAHLDRAYILQQAEVESIQTQAWNAFRKYVFHDKDTSLRVKTGILDWIDRERKLGESPGLRHSISTLITSLTTLGIYSTTFEEPLLERTATAYAAEGAEFARSLTPADYMEHWRSRCAQESERAAALFPKGTGAAVVAVAEKAFLAPRAEWLSRQGLKHALDEENVDRIASLYKLLKGVGEVEPLRKGWIAHVEASVRGVVTDPEAESMVDNLLKLKAFTEQVLVVAFEEGSEVNEEEGKKKAKQRKKKVSVKRGPFSEGLDDAFEAGFAAGGKKPAEMIAKFIDKKMQEGQRNASDAAFMKMLNDVLALFRYTRDKDVFRVFYTRGLARRLLRSRSASDDFERAVIKQLREEHDPEFGKGDEMFKDLELSHDFTQDFHVKHREDRALSVSILQVSSWPFSRQENSKGFVLDLPPDMVNTLNRFSRFYTTRHPNRKLEWAHELATASMTARFPKGTKELSVSLSQAAVLLLFNDSPELKVSDIAALTHMEDAELRRTMQSLALGKYRVLSKSPAGREVHDDDVFAVNDAFTDPRAKIQLPTIRAPAVAAAEDKKTNEQIEAERGYTLDAALVRIMKSKKRSSHEHLVAGTIEAVAKHFVPSVDMIKKRIEYLIEAEYMKRAEESRNVYEYIA